MLYVLLLLRRRFGERTLPPSPRSCQTPPLLLVAVYPNLFGTPLSDIAETEFATRERASPRNPGLAAWRSSRPSAGTRR